jgi:hypothetical protein
MLLFVSRPADCYCGHTLQALTAFLSLFLRGKWLINAIPGQVPHSTQDAPFSESGWLLDNYTTRR